RNLWVVCGGNRLTYSGPLDRETVADHMWAAEHSPARKPKTMKTPNDPLCRREFLKHAAQATAALGITASGAPVVTTLAAHAREGVSPAPSRNSYFCNGEIQVNDIGKPEGKPLTTGHMDFKPSWSKTDNMLVCFRRTKDDPVTVNWKSAIFVISVDGSGF